MNSLMILLLLVGIGLVVFEVFLPGFGVPGIAGLFCVGLSATLAIIYIENGLVIVVGGLVVIALIIWSLMKWLRTKQMYKGVILEETLAFEKSEVGTNEKFIGKEGIAIVPLRPFGSVEFNGVKMDAYSESGFIPKGRTVKVVNIENERIIVKELN